MDRSMVSDAVLDAQHDTNCAKIANWLLTLSKANLCAIIAYGDKARRNRIECDARHRLRKRGELVANYTRITPDAQRFCSVCGKQSKHSGLCSKHEHRQKLHGDPLLVRKHVAGVGLVLHKESPDGTFARVDAAVRDTERVACIVCGEPSLCDALCKKHYDVSLMMGTPGKLADDVVAYQQALAKSKNRR